MAVGDVTCYGNIELRDVYYENYFNSDRDRKDFTESGSSAFSASAGYLAQTNAAATRYCYLTLSDADYNIGCDKEDYTVECKVRIPAGGTDVGLMGRVGSSGQHYAVRLSTTAANTKIEEYTDWTSIVAPGYVTNGELNTALAVDTWYKIKLKFSGTSISVYKDGTLLGTGTDATLTEGGAGLKTYSSTGHFDNLKWYREKISQGGTSGTSWVNHLSVTSNLSSYSNTFSADFKDNALNPIEMVENKSMGAFTYAADQSQTTMGLQQDITANGWTQAYCQTFKPAQTSMDKVELMLKKTGSPTGTFYVYLARTNSNGEPVGSMITAGSYNIASLTTDSTAISIGLQYNNFDVNKTYALEFLTLGGTVNATNYVSLQYTNSSAYASGKKGAYSSAAWTMSATDDFWFKTYYRNTNLFDLTLLTNETNITEFSLYNEDDVLVNTAGIYPP